LTPAAQEAMPGGSVTYELRVRNTGTVVDELTFEALGDGAGWIRVEPAVLPLFPGVEETVRVTVAPPYAASTPVGPLVFGVRAVSREDPGGSAVAEATVDVGAFRELFVELVPRTARGRRRGSTDLALDNRGNAPVDVRFRGLDADGTLDVEVEPPAVTADPGTATFAGVVVRPRKRFARGPSKTLPFQVVADGEDGTEPLVVDGTMVQEALLPKWLLRALALVVLLALLAIPLWFAFLRPSIESTAKEAAQDEVQAALAAGGGGSGAGGGGTSTTPTTTTTVPDARAETGEPNAVRLTADANPGASANDAFTVPDGRVFRLTDIVLQNPQGDTGRLEVRRGDDVLLTLALQNFRDVDYHFVAPIVFEAGQQLELSLACQAVTDPATRCNPSGSFLGFLGTP
jgi:hypothetical protein